MADGVDISLIGDKALQRKFARLAPALQKKIARKELRKAAKPILNDIKAAAPKGPTGLLRRKMKLRAMKRSRQRIGVFIRTGTRSELDIKPDEAYYPAVVEFGTTTRTADPFMRPAFKKNVAKAKTAIGRGIGSAIEAEAKKT